MFIEQQLDTELQTASASICKETAHKRLPALRQRQANFDNRPTTHHRPLNARHAENPQISSTMSKSRPTSIPNVFIGSGSIWCNCE